MTPAPTGRYRDGLLTILAVILVAAALRASYPVAMPAAFAGIIVAAAWPLKPSLDRWLPSWLSQVATILVLIAVLFAFFAAMWFSVGQITDALADRWEQLREGFARLAGTLQRLGVPLDQAADPQRLLGLVQGTAARLYDFTIYIGFIVILVILALGEVGRFRRKLEEHAGRDEAEKYKQLARSVSSQVRVYLRTTLVTSVITGVASTLMALATGLELPLVWGLLNFLLNFVPIIGNIVGILPPVLFAFLQFGGWWMPLIVFVGYAALQIAISNFLYPILQGKQLSLSPLAILIAMTFWGWVWGIAGALIAVPLTAILVIACKHFERSRWIATLLSA